MRKTAYLLAVAVLLCGASAFAQGAFNDVPTDHWGYDAVNQLQKEGIVIGYPDGTYGGKRAMSRYEFAVAIARLLPMITETDLSNYVTKSELADALKPYAKTADLPDFSKFATKADLDALRKLIDEFRDELAALGVDVDALKRDLAALTARVEALEAEQRRVKWYGDVNIFGIASSADEGIAVDLDERETRSFNDGGLENTIGRTIAVVRDFDLKMVGRVSDTVNVHSTINYGNYLNYLRWVDDYVDGPRPTDKNDFQPLGRKMDDGYAAIPDGFGDTKNFVDGFFPYYLYIDWALCKGNLQVGRFPLQFTPYTLRKIDVDSYTSILKTDDGNYPVDGIKLAWQFGGVDVTLFAVKHDQNDYLLNGLTGQPNAGLFKDQFGGVFHDAGGHGVGGLDELITQSAGARVTLGTPWKGVLGLTYYQAWSKDAFFDEPFDQARVFGADLNIPLGTTWNFYGSWTQSDTMANDRAPGVDDIDDDNTAWDVKLAGAFGKLGIGGGYKEIEYNFAAAGYWDKIGRWTNPTNIKGPYVDLCYAFGSNFKFEANAEFLEFIDGPDVDITKAEGDINWQFSKRNAFNVNYQWVSFEDDFPGSDDAEETYLTIGWAHQMSQNAGFKVGYQFINYDGGNTGGPYATNDVFNDYKGGLGVVQFGVTF